MPHLALTPPPPVSSTPRSPAGSVGALDALNQRLEELSDRVEQLEVISGDTEKNVVGIYDKLDELTLTVEAQERTFSKRLADALAQLTAQAVDNQSLVAELCAKVQSQEAQLQKLMEEREAAPVEVESSSPAAGAVTGAATTRGYLSRAAKAVGL